MKKLYLLLLFSAISLSAISEELIIKEFSEATTDLSASTNLEKDINDNPCALIIVYMDADNVTFSSSTLVKSCPKNKGEYWVYMATGSKRLTINAPGYLPIIDFPFSKYGINSLQGKVTYKMIIDAPPLGEKKSVRTTQYLEFHVAPIGVNACIQIEGEDELHYVDNDGLYSSLRVLGSYTYTIFAPDYYPQTSAVIVNDPDNKKIVEISLIPSFGYLKLTSAKEYNGATVSIDGKVYGNLPLDRVRLPKGEHEVTISKSRYATQKQSVSIRDNEAITTLAVKMSARFITATISTEDKDADLWLDDKYIGRGEAEVDLGFGNHVICAKKDKHKDAIVELKDVNAEYSTQVQVPSPQPITGIVNILSTPQGATIRVDGSEIGTSPMLKTVLIGSHTIELEKKGYQKEKKLVDLKEGETLKVEFKLSNVFDINFTANVIGAELFVDGKSCGKIPTSVKLQTGTHSVMAKKKGYETYNCTINSESCNNKCYVKLEKLLKAKVVRTSYSTDKSTADEYRVSSNRSAYNESAYNKSAYNKSTYNKSTHTYRKPVIINTASLSDYDDVLSDFFDVNGKFQYTWIGADAYVGTGWGVTASIFEWRFHMFEIAPLVFGYGEAWSSTEGKLGHQICGAYYAPNVRIYFPFGSDGKMAFSVASGPIISFDDDPWFMAEIAFGEGYGIFNWRVFARYNGDISFGVALKICHVFNKK